jgi:hypothetical protein
MGLVSLLLIIYEIITSLCCHDKHPDFLFAENDLEDANTAVLKKRK